MPPHPLTNFEIQKYYQNEPKSNGVYSKDNLPNKIKDGAYVIHLHEYSNIGTHWVALYVYMMLLLLIVLVQTIFLKKLEYSINKNIKSNIFRIQAYDSIMCGYLCIGFTDFMFKGKSLTEYRNLFSPNNFKENDDIILNYFVNNTYI